MTGPDLIAALQGEGFTIRRRSKALVWLVRGEDELLIDSDGDVEAELALDILTRARRPPQ